jgi:hypothetical protein
VLEYGDGTWGTPTVTEPDWNQKTDHRRAKWLRELMYAALLALPGSLIVFEEPSGLWSSWFSMGLPFPSSICLANDGTIHASLKNVVVFLMNILFWGMPSFMTMKLAKSNWRINGSFVRPLVLGGACMLWLILTTFFVHQSYCFSIIFLGNMSGPDVITVLRMDALFYPFFCLVLMAFPITAVLFMSRWISVKSRFVFVLPCTLLTSAAAILAYWDSQNPCSPLNWMARHLYVNELMLWLSQR